MVLPQWISRLGGGRTSRRDDPYWDIFINQPPADLANTVIDMIRFGNACFDGSHVKIWREFYGSGVIHIVPSTSGFS